MSKRAFITPFEPAGELILAPLWLSMGEDWEAIPRGVLTELLKEWNFEQLPGGESVEDTIAAYQDDLSKTFRQWTDPQQYFIRAALLKSKNLIGYWPLWEGSGAVLAKDRSGNGFDGTPANHVWESAGIGDGYTAIDFNGSTARLNVYSTALRDLFSGDYGTLAAWVNADNWQQTGSHYAARLANVTSQYVQFGHASGGYVTYDFKSPGLPAVNLNIDKSGGAFTGWHHMALTWRVGRNVTAYLDGEQIGSVAHPGTWGSSQIALAVLGAFNTTPINPLDGKMAHAMLFNAELEPREVAYLATL